MNNRYKCPDHSPCGEHPNCVVGRKGPGCTQPDVQPCSGAKNRFLLLTVLPSNEKTIIAVIDTTFAVVKRKPEKKSGLYGIRTL